MTPSPETLPHALMMLALFVGFVALIRAIVLRDDRL
jgi:hypothetical protein